MKRSGWSLGWMVLALLSFCTAAAARDAVPVYGPARAAVDDEDLLGDTILDVGVFAVAPDRPWQVFIGDGLTRGGVPIHADGCVTNFNDIHVATTNLDMGGWSVTWGPWNAHGDVNEWDLGYGKAENWLRFVRNTGEAYLHYDFSIVAPDDWRFVLAWTDAETLPVLEVSTNLMEGFAAAAPETATYARLDASHLQIDFVPGDSSAYFFRLFAATRMETGIYADEPFHAKKGVTVPAGQGIAMGTNTWNEWPDVGGIATNAANAAVAPVEGMAITNAGNIATNAEQIAANAAAIAANSASIASNAAALAAITNALGQRISEFECVHIAYIPSTATSDTFFVPTNCPTRNLAIHLLVTTYNSTNLPCVVRIPEGWNPGRPMTVRLYASGSTNTRISYGIGGNQHVVMTGPNARECEYVWLPEANQWELHYRNVANGFDNYSSVGARVTGATRLGTMPTSIASWIEWRQQQPW